MPVTVNGIGTRYYGQSNRAHRKGSCRACGRHSALTSYDTRLFFCVMFVPVIPLGRKRIIDACGICQRHFIVPADTWEAARQLDISGALYRYETDPTPENAMASHDQMLAYLEFDRATAFRGELLRKYGENSHVQAGLGAALSQLGRLEDSVAHYKKALELRPDLPEARSGLAMHRLREGKIAEARALVDYLEKPGAEHLYSLAPLEQVALAFQRTRKYDEALQVFGRLLEALPHLGQNVDFRKHVIDCEKALKRKTTILPRRKRRFQLGGGRFKIGKTLAYLGVTLALLLLGFLFVNAYALRQRDVYLVNAYSKPALVKITGATSQLVRGEMVKARLTEGRHHVVISGPVSEQFDLDIKSASFSDRWFGHPLWIIDVGGGAVFLEQQARYSHQQTKPPALKWHYGESLLAFRNVEYAFCPPPPSMAVSEQDGEKVVASVMRVNSIHEAMEQMVSAHRGDEALQLGEWRLGQQPNDAETLNKYISIARRANDPARAITFLLAGIGRRPVEVVWHRTLQDMLVADVQKKTIAEKYDAMVAAEPASSALLYLRGRVAATAAEAMQYYERAAAADEKNAWPLYALAYYEASRANWSAARDHAAKACALQPTDADFEALLYRCRMGLGETDALEQAARKNLKTAWGLTPALRVCEQLAIGGHGDAALAFVEGVQKEALLRRKQGRPSSHWTIELRCKTLYATGHFNQLEQETTKSAYDLGRRYALYALIGQGRTGEAERRQLLPKPETADAMDLLAVSTGFRLENSAQEASKFLLAAEAAYESSGDEADRRTAAALRAPMAPTLQEIDEIVTDPSQKALLLAVLALMNPTHATEYAPTATALNVGREAPYWLVQKALAAAVALKNARPVQSVQPAQPAPAVQQVPVVQPVQPTQPAPPIQPAPAPKSPRAKPGAASVATPPPVSPQKPVSTPTKKLR